MESSSIPPTPRRDDATTRRLVAFLTIITLIASQAPVDATDAPTPDTWTVCAFGCDSTTIQGAVELTMTGDTILIAPGTYIESPLLHKKGLTLCPLEGSTNGSCGIDADGSDDDVVIQVGHQPATVTAQDVTIRSLHMTGASALLEADGARGLILDSNTFDADLLPGPGADAIRLMNTDDALLKANQVRLSVRAPALGGDARAIHATAGSNSLQVLENTIMGDLHPATVAIDVEGGRAPLVQANTVHSAHVAVRVKNTDDARILDNVLIRNTVGILLDGVEGVSVERNHVEGLDADGNVLLTRAPEDDLLQVGILLQGGTRNYVLRDNIVDLTWTGIRTSPSTGPGHIEGNTLQRNGLRGINLEASIGTVVQDNTFFLEPVPGGPAAPGSTTGVWVQGAQDTHIEGNTFSGHGVAVDTTILELPQGTYLPDGLMLRGNDMAVQGTSLHLGPGVQSLAIDARLNGWGVGSWRALEGRVLDEGSGNTVQQLPYIDPASGPEPGFVRVEGKPGRYLSVQEAVTAAEPGDTVVVSTSAHSVDPTPRSEVVHLDKPLTLCGTIRGGDLCGADVQAGSWELSGSDWAAAPAATEGEAIRMDLPGDPIVGSTSFYVQDPLQVSGLHALSFEYFVEQGDCRAGSPRIGLNTDFDGDGTQDSKIYIYSRTLQSQGCTAGSWQYVNLMDAQDGQWQLPQPGSPKQATQAEALAWLETHTPDHQVRTINLEWDNGDLAYVDNQRINDWTLGERIDIGCFHLAKVPCRTHLLRERAVIDGAGLDRVTLHVTNEDVTVQDLTVRNSGLGLPEGQSGGAIEVRGDRAVIQRMLVEGDLLPTDPFTNDADLDPRITAMGIIVRGGADDYLLQDNELRRWEHTGVWLTGGAGSGTVQHNDVRANGVEGIRVSADDGTAVTLRDNVVGPGRWSAIQVEGKTSATLEGNTLLGGLDPSGAGTVWLRGSGPATLTNNTFLGNDAPAVALTPHAHMGTFPEHVVMRDNRIVATLGPDHVAQTAPAALYVSSGVEGVVVDARENDWGVYSCPTIHAQLNDEGSDNRLLFEPFLDASGQTRRCAFGSLGATALIEPRDALRTEAISIVESENGVYAFDIRLLDDDGDPIEFRQWRVDLIGVGFRNDDTRLSIGNIPPEDGRPIDLPQPPAAGGNNLIVTIPDNQFRVGPAQLASLLDFRFTAIDTTEQTVQWTTHYSEAANDLLRQEPADPGGADQADHQHTPLLLAPPAFPDAARLDLTAIGVTSLLDSS